MMRRTTVTASEDDFAVLAGEARRRGVSLAQVLREAVVEKAAELRRARKPRFGLGRSADGDGSRRAVEEEHAPLDERRGT
jgi:hypothetical protein